MLAVFFVLLASTSPLEYLGPFRSFWARNFLLKPNHALGLALTPVALRLLSRWTGWRRGALSFLVLAALGWVFVIDWLIVTSCLGFYGVLRYVREGRTARSELSRQVAVVILAALPVIPYVLFIARQFPNAVSLA